MCVTTPEYGMGLAETYLNLGSPKTPESAGFRGEHMTLIVNRTKVKETVKDCNMSNSFADALDAKVRDLVIAAVARAKANNRRTVMPKDL